MVKAQKSTSEQARRFVLGGRVQGVGFRPFVYRLGHVHKLRGWVRNLTGRVEIFAQGEVAALERFAHELVHSAPPLARPEILASEIANPAALSDFSILTSERADHPDVHVPPDYFACDDCLREMSDPGDRRYRYPFINCTQCGPRYTLIAKLPYDRPNTTMASFALCDRCREEYENPLDRRFHAEPLACADCGPQLTFFPKGGPVLTGTETALAECVALLRRGGIVAAKGVGGYHLLCDATNETAVAMLRERKHRPHKPLAVMFPVRGSDGLDAVREVAALTDEHINILRDPMRPIVLVPTRERSSLAAAIAPGLREIGAFLPYSPLHHLIVNDFGGPLVATSGNISGEPVLTNECDAQARLAHIADAFLHHNREITRPADDSVYRVIAGKARPLRIGRGVAPMELSLPGRLPAPLIATGAHMKNTVALAWEDRVVVSPHIGDLDTPRALAVFERVIGDLQQLYGVRAESVVCDAHPGYAGTRWARHSGLPVAQVYHHRAHASAVAGEHGDVKRWLVFTWDGVGYGEDGTLWGGEALFGQPGEWKRVASFRPFHLPGGEQAGREPWRAALALSWELGIEWLGCPEDIQLLRQAWGKRLNSPATSAVGRLFDAGAAFVGLNLRSSFEGQGPMLLEASCAQASMSGVSLPLGRDSDGIWRSNWEPLLAPLLASGTSASDRGRIFHASLAQALTDQACRIREVEGEFTVGLAGGVFQNAVLVTEIAARLASAGFELRLARLLPSNDAAISFGQAIETAARQQQRDA